MLNQELARDLEQDSLSIVKETIQDLEVSAADQAGVKGGWIRPPISWSCPQPGSVYPATGGQVANG